MMDAKEKYYLMGIDDAIQVLEDLRDGVSGAYEMGILAAISELEKYYDAELHNPTIYEDANKITEVKK